MGLIRGQTLGFTLQGHGPQPLYLKAHTSQVTLGDPHRYLLLCVNEIREGSWVLSFALLQKSVKILPRLCTDFHEPCTCVNLIMLTLD